MSEIQNPPLSLEGLLRAHALIRADLKDQADRLDLREAELRAALAECLSEQDKILERQKALDTTEALYRDMLGHTVGHASESAAAVQSSAPRTADSAKPRARIGPQRYQMFIALRATPDLSRLEIADVTGLSDKRVKDQMVCDIQAGFVSETSDKLRLTEAGKDLLERFEAYKRAKGEALPQLGDASDDEDGPATHEIGGATEGGASAADVEQLLS